MNVGASNYYNPWQMGDQDDSDNTIDEDYWKVPKVEGWIVHNDPETLTPWGVNMADALPVLSTDARR